MLCYRGKLSLAGFIGTLGLTLGLFYFFRAFSAFVTFVPSQIPGIVYWGPLQYFGIICMGMRYMLRDNSEYETALCASLLGLIFSIGWLLFMYGISYWQPFGAYCCTMAFFHYSEYITIAWSNPRALSNDTFLLKHSAAYGLAAAASISEYLIEVYFYPDLKEFKSIMWIGITICVVGELLRKLAILTAKSNFNHMVQFEKADDHKLVTHGIYRFMRHPSYVGWFWWSIGTQIIVSNPICFILYSIVSWRFFRERIYTEEITLLNFFGMDYITYQENVSTGLPFIKGYQLEREWMKKDK